MPQNVALKAALTEQIRLLADAGVTQLLSGMAEATDTWSAISVLALRENNPALKFHCILPCKEQADKWTASSRDLYLAKQYADSQRSFNIHQNVITALIASPDFASSKAFKASL